MGESYNGICALADLFAVVKIPNKLSGTVAGEWLLYLSSNLVGPRIFIFQKKSYPLLFLISTLTPATHFVFIPFCFSYLYLYPHYLWKVILIHTFRPFGVSL